MASEWCELADMWIFAGGISAFARRVIARRYSMASSLDRLPASTDRPTDPPPKKRPRGPVVGESTEVDLEVDELDVVSYEELLKRARTLVADNRRLTLETECDAVRFDAIHALTRPELPWHPKEYLAGIRVIAAPDVRERVLGPKQVSGSESSPPTSHWVIPDRTI